MKTVYLLAEKVIWTYIQALIVLLTAGNGLTISFSTTLAIAALPAAFTVLANGIPQVSAGLPFAVDLTFRVLRTGAVAFLGYLTAIPVFSLDYSVLYAASLAAATAVLAVVKGAAADRLGQLGTAALMPASMEPTANPPLAA